MPRRIVPSEDVGTDGENPQRFKRSVREAFGPYVSYDVAPMEYAPSFGERVAVVAFRVYVIACVVAFAGALIYGMGQLCRVLLS